jgi:hypothetical protein
LRQGDAVVGGGDFMKIGDPFSIKGLQVGPGPEQSAASGRQPRATLELTPGQLVLGRVVSVVDPNRVLLSIANRTVTAETSVLLQEGEELWLEVKQGGEKPWFVLAEKKAAAHALLRAMLADAPALGRALKGLQELGGILRQDLPPELVNRLSALLQSVEATSLGAKPAPEAVVRLLLWLQEPEFAPRKGKQFPRLDRELVGFWESLRQSGASGPAGLNGADLKRLASFLELLGHLNSRPLADEQPPFFLFPCFFSGGAGWGEWLFSLEDDGAETDGAPSYTLEFFLDMSRLGDVHLRLGVVGQAVQGEVSLVDEQAVEHVEGMLPELQGILENLGYGPVVIRCNVSQKNHLQGLKEALEDKARLRTPTLFHVTA